MVQIKEPLESPTGTHRIVAVDQNQNVVGGGEDSVDDLVNSTVSTNTAALHSRYAVAW